MLRHDNFDKWEGDNLTVSNGKFYQLHLPVDVLRSVAAANIVNSGVGGSPQYLNFNTLVNFFVAVVTLPYVLAISALNFAADLATLAVNMGLQLVGYLASAISATVAAAQTAVVDAFNAFVAWAIEFICDAFEALIAQPLAAIYDSIQGWAAGLISLTNTASANIEGGGMSNSSASLPIFQYIIDSDIFKTLTLIGLSLFAVITLASFLGPFSFIGMLVVPFLMDMLISGMTAALFTLVNVPDLIGWVADTILDALGTDLAGGMAGVMGATMGTITWIAAQMYSPVIADIDGFVLSTIGAVFAWMGSMEQDWTKSLILDIIGFGFSIYGCYEIFFNKESVMQKLSPTAKSIMKGISGLELGISSFELVTTVASYDQ